MANILVFFQGKPDYAAALEKKGHKVFCFTEKAAALDCGRSQRLDLALLDMNQSGLEVLGELRQSQPDLRGLLVTRALALATIRQAISLGVQEIMVDPLEMSDLENKVNKVLKAQKRNLKEALAL